MSELEGNVVECDRCQKEIKQSKVIQDKGIDHPELLKKAKEDDRDFIQLCPVCADIDVEIGSDNSSVESKMSNIRKFL